MKKLLEICLIIVAIAVAVSCSSLDYPAVSTADSEDISAIVKPLYENGELIPAEQKTEDETAENALNATIEETASVQSGYTDYLVLTLDGVSYSEKDYGECNIWDWGTCNNYGEEGPRYSFIIEPDGKTGYFYDYSDYSVGDMYGPYLCKKM